MATDSTPKTYMEEIMAGGGQPLDKALMAFGESTYKAFSRGRYIEEKLWQQQGLMYQGKQWLDWDTDARRWIEQKPDKKKPRPMPITNYLAKTVNAQANQLGAQLPQIETIILDESPDSERAADMASRAKDVIDQESGMIFLNPILAKHVPLFGLVAIKDYWDESTSNGVRRDEQTETSQDVALGCEDCGETSHQSEYQLDDEAPPEPWTDGTPCPQCGKTNTQAYPETKVDQVTVTRYGKGKIKSRLISCFEIYVSRECDDPNLAPRVLERTRRPVGELRRMHPEVADDIHEDSTLDISQYRLQTLRSMMGYTFGSEDRAKDLATVCEVYSEWDEIPKKLQDMLEKEFSGSEYEEEDIERAQAAGIYFKYLPAQGLMLEWGINKLVDEQNGQHYFPYTFFMWEKDPASPYPNALAFQLVPLQKMLNQVDSLMLLANMSNSVGKWLAPKTQAGTFKPDGSPTEVIWYDNVGDGKAPPSYTQPTALDGRLYQFRAQIINDFMSLGLTEAVTQGQAPGGGVGSFRGIAYLGAKADEQTSTQRQLWEESHEHRYRKVILMARLFWDDDRKAKVAGTNGKFRALTLNKTDLVGNYEITLKPGSSKPKLLSEKIGFIQLGIEGKLLDPTDPALRETLLTMLGLGELDARDHVHVEKAERDLDKAKRGEMPPLANPFIKWDVHLRFFTEYTLSEEFEEQTPDIQNFIMNICQQLNEKIQEVAANAAMGQVAQAQLGAAGGSQPGTPPEKGMAEAMANGNNQNPLGGIAGQNTTAAQIEQAATAQGAHVANQVPS
jgi:hypothetical protein